MSFKNTMRPKLILIFISILMMGIGDAAYSSDNSVKWHPGHYYTILSHGKNKPGYMRQVYQELKSTPALRGLQVRYNWKELEPQEGVYNFSLINQHLSELAEQNKRLVILFELKSFGPDIKQVTMPEYVKAEKYEGGVYPFNNYGKGVIRGYGIKLWNPFILDRLTLLVRALGEQFNSHPYFEGIGFTESSMGESQSLTNNKMDDYYRNLLRLNKEARRYFPNTMTYQFANYPRRILGPFIETLKETGTALGGPDIFMEDQGLLQQKHPKGAYHYYPELSGTVPLTPSVQHQNYQSTRWDGTGYEPDVTELLAFARDRLKANYLFWTRDPKYYSRVLKMLNKLDLSDPAGGLDSTCPKAFSSCVN